MADTSFHYKENGTIVIAVAGGKGGTGKSTQAAQIALTFAEAGKKVIYADCDNAMPCGPEQLHVKDEEYNVVLDEDRAPRGFGDIMRLDFKSKKPEDKARIGSFKLSRFVRKFTDMGEFNEEERKKIEHEVEAAMRKKAGKQLEGIDLSEFSLEKKVDLLDKKIDPDSQILPVARHFLGGRRFGTLDILYAGSRIEETSERGLNKTQKRFYLDNFLLLKEHANKEGYDIVVLDMPAGLPPFSLDGMHVSFKVMVTNPEPQAYNKVRILLKEVKKRTLFHSVQKKTTRPHDFQGLDIGYTLKTIIAEQIQKNPVEAKQNLGLMLGGCTEMSGELKRKVAGYIQEGSPQSLTDALGKINFRIESEDDLEPFYGSIRADTTGSVDERVAKVVKDYRGYIIKLTEKITADKKRAKAYKGNPEYDQDDVRELEERIVEKTAHLSRVGLIGKIIGSDTIKNVLKKMEQGIHDGCRVQLILNKCSDNEDQARALGERLAKEFSDEIGINVHYLGGLTNNTAIMRVGMNFYLGLPRDNISVQQGKQIAEDLYRKITGKELYSLEAKK